MRDMMGDPSIGRLDHLTFKGNLRETRHGWLRLTPAYSVHLVAEILSGATGGEVILDPFCGTGTTALVCAERGIECDTTDINPFLLWLARAKARRYTDEERGDFARLSAAIVKGMSAVSRKAVWAPPLHQVEKWWDKGTIRLLGRAMGEIERQAKGHSEGTIDLLRVVFCRVMIESANVSFGHQSMSFKKRAAEGGRVEDRVSERWRQAAAAVEGAAASPIVVEPRPLLCDARELGGKLKKNRYTRVITSPPYPNRMSYIRELRPYMYWLGYLSDGRAAGELDWQAIGGTWGCATSNVSKWSPEVNVAVPFDGFGEILEGIAVRSGLLSRYVHKYFYDMMFHCKELFGVVKPGGSLHYIVGNSKFYDVLLPVEEIFAAMFRAMGFANVEVRTIRKRTSKKELFEFVVSGQKPAATTSVRKAGATGQMSLNFEPG